MHKLQKHLVIIFLVITQYALSQNAPSIEWQRSLGGSLGETSQWVTQTTDSGILIAGYAWSHNGDVVGIKGMSDIWIVKMDLAGNITWQQCIGGTKNDVAYYIQQTKDGGYVVSGYSRSSDGDLTTNNGITDYCVIRLNSDGNILWRTSLGGSDEEWGYPAKECSDGGFVVAGFSKSGDGDVSQNYGDWDYWVVKLDADGNIEWEKAMGGSDEDEAYDVVETNDGGFIVVGGTDSNDFDVSGNHGDGDNWVVKLDAVGNIVWQKCYGGSEEEYAYAIIKTSDGGFVIAGESTSHDGDLTENKGLSDFWVFKIDGSGNLLWQKSYGGSEYEMATCIAETADGGLIFTGDSYSSDGDVSHNHGSKDYWVVRTDASGNVKWEKSLGGSGLDHANGIVQLADGSYIVTGSSFSNDGDVSGNHGNSLGNSEDYWVVKLKADDESGLALLNKESIINVFPNPASDFLIALIPAEHLDSFCFISNVYGRRSEQSLTLKNGKIEINTSELIPGLYFLQLEDRDKGNISTATFMVSR